MEQTGPAVSVVLPTYNEADSLKVIVPRIFATLGEARMSCEVIVVDDASPDGTAAVARELAQRHPELRVIERRGERGLATAVLRGFEEARAPVCAVMDADGSHPVSALPQMVRLVSEDKADIAVGSRNIPGGGSQNWPLFSQIKSKLAAALSFGLTSLTDPTTGYMVVRKSLLRELPLDPVGWKIVLEVAVKAAPVRIAEVPIVFEERDLGESKQSLRVFLQYALHLLKLYAYRYPTLAELARFCAVGLLGVFVDLGTVLALKELLGLDTRLCAVAGFAAAVTSNYVLNRYFTFARGRELPLLWSYLTYVGTNLVGLSVRVATVHAFMLLTDLDQGRGYLLTNAIGIALATVFNFAGAKYLAFDPQRLAFAPAGGPAPADEPEPGIAPGARAGAAAVLAAALIHATLASFSAGAGPALAGWRATSLLSLCAIVLFSALLLRPDSKRAALYCAVLLACSPGFLSLGLSLEREPLLTALFAAGLYAGVLGTRARHRGACLAGGALLGLGVVGNPWLVVPYALAACAFVLVQTTLVRAREETPLALRRSVLAGMLGFALAAGARLLLAALWSPGDVPGWLAPGGFDLAATTAAAPAAGEARELARTELWYYPALLFREHFYLLPLSLFGLPALLRRNRAYAIVVLAMGFGACLGVVVLSVPSVRGPEYMLPVLPPLYMLAAVSLAELERDSVKYRPANIAAVQAVLALAAISALAVWISHAGGELRVTARYALLHTAGMVACAAIGLAWIARRRLDAPLIAACALALLGAAVGS